MSKKTFKPHDWLTANGSINQTITSQPKTTPPPGDLETITQRIEATHLDIAPGYADWRDLGFALVDALGESGRSYFHRLSRYHTAYNPTGTNRQYDKCIQSTGHGITLKTLFHLAGNAGVKIAIPKPVAKPAMKNAKAADPDEAHLPGLPTFPDHVYAGLPYLLGLATQKTLSPEDRDLLLLGSLVAISACLPNIYGIYAEREVYPNLFLFITAQASAGKGRLTLCRRLVEPIHQALRQQATKENQEYQRQLSQYITTKNKAGIEQPKEPPLRMLIIPANNSATGLFQILNDNQGVGLIFETEGDTLAQTFKSEHGNYSDGFRKAFHHETISYNRRKDREYVELTNPRLSALLSGTPRQVATLIPSAENGLFSRFIFYTMNLRPQWKDVFAGDSDQTLDRYFAHIGDQFHDFHKQLKNLNHPIRFTLTKQQQQAFNHYFTQAQEQYLYLCGSDYLATVRRLGLITFRIAMILTTLRIINTDSMATPLTCSDADFQTTLAMIKTLMQHAAQVYQQLPAEPIAKKQLNLRQLFFDTLPHEFTRQDYLVIAQKLDIPSKTAEKHIARFAQNALINHFAQSKYRKNTS